MDVRAERAGGASDYADDVIVPLGGLLLIFYLQSEGLLRTDLPQHVAGISFLFRFFFLFPRPCTLFD